MMVYASIMLDRELLRNKKMRLPYWFEPLILTYTPDGSTLLQGSLPDQSALYGMLNQIAQLGLTLLSVESAPGAGRDALHRVEHRPPH
jgi:hypothetical protein